MPAPKMRLNDRELNQPNYGYTASIHTNVNWKFVGGNYSGYIKGKPYLTTEFETICDQIQTKFFEECYSKDVYLILGTNNGFYPFSPLLNKNSYLVRVQTHEYTTPQATPWLYVNHNLSLVYRENDLPEFTNETNPEIEGDIFIRKNDDIITGIREIGTPGELSLHENNNVVITRGGIPYNIESQRKGYNITSGIVSEIELTGKQNKIKSILSFLLKYRDKPFYISTPDYWLFGNQIPMESFIYGVETFRAYQVVCINDPIDIVHNYINNFSIKLKLALVV